MPKLRQVRYYELVSLMEITHTYKILVGKSEGKGPLGRSTSKYEDNIKMCHRTNMV